MKKKIEADFKVIEVHKRSYVLTPSGTRDEKMGGEANFLGTGMALCGVLKKDETLSEFLMNRYQKNS